MRRHEQPARKSVQKGAAPADGQLSPAMLTDYHEAGVVLIEDFVSVDACRQLQARALELVDAFDPTEVRSVFSAINQTQLDDSYFE